MVMSLHNNNIDCVEMFKVALQKGINLFTGAGFSILPDADGNILPTANDLCEEICERFSINPNYKDDLEKLSNIVKIRYKDEFQAYLREKFKVSSYNKRYDVLNSINLCSYITTNIDNIIQCVMDHSKRYSLFNVVEYGAKRASSSLLFIPLHGNVKYLNSNLYFGKNELANVDTDNKDLFDLMHGELLKVPTLFWGYGFHDNAVERTITKLLQEGHQDIWILCRPGNENIDYFRDLGCHVIEGETLELLDWIEENCSEVQPGSSDPIDTSSLQQYLIPSLNSLEVVTQEDYYAKGITHWFCILSDYAYQTKNVNLLYNDALQRKNVIAVGIPFSGKTTMMMQIAAKAQADIKLLLSNISVEEAQRIINLLHSHRVFSFVDSCCDDVSVTKLLMQQPNFTVLGFTDDYAFESSKHLLDDVPYYRKDITEVEWVDAQGIYSKIPQSLRKSKLEYKKSEDEKYSILELITSNVKDVLSQQRVRGLLDRVKSNSETTFQIIALSAYLTCNKSCLNMDVLCSFLGITDYHILKKHIDATQSYLREIDVGLSQDINNQDYYELRSNLFAWLAYDELRKHFQKDFGDIVSKFILNVSPYKIFQRHIFRRSGYDAKLFSELFGKDAYKLYECIYRFDNSAYTLQQQALCKAYLGDFSGAFSDIDKALNKSRSNFSIRNSHAIILFEANKGKRTPIAEEGMAKAMSMLQECFHSDKRKVYHAQKFADFALYLAKEWGKKDYLEDAQTWLEQIVASGESQSVRTKNLLDHVRSQIARE